MGFPIFFQTNNGQGWIQDFGKRGRGMRLSVNILLKRSAFAHMYDLQDPLHLDPPLNLEGKSRSEIYSALRLFIRFR